MRVILTTLMILLSACTGSEDDTSTPEAPTELYSPSAQYEVDVTVKNDIQYTDVLGAQRSFNVAIYRPVDAPTPLPVVILSHGGSSGKTNPQGVLAPWPQAFASAGYLAIGIAHPFRGEASYDALCDHLGVSDDIQCSIKINWDRPHDVSAVIDWLEDQAAGNFEGVIDLTKIAHFGHSAGAGCAMMLAGAPRNYLCSQTFGAGQGETVPCDPADLVSKKDNRIKAIVGLSPQGPGTDGFMEQSYADIDIPVLLGTGKNDGDEGEPQNRSQAFDYLNDSATGDQRFFLYLDNEGTAHTLFQGSLDKCSQYVEEAQCAEMRDWLVSSALAFFDHIFHERAEATTWMTTGGPSGLSGGVATWSQK